MQNDPANYDVIGQTYNTTRCADPYLLSRIIHHLQPVDHGKYLDVGCGTGNYTIALNNAGYALIGIDPSDIMLKVAKSKPSRVEWMQGSSESLPFNNNEFDGAIATLTVHHWKERKKGLQEISRALKPGAHFVIFTSSPEQMKDYWLNHYFPDIMQRSIENMPSAESIIDGLLEFGFTDVRTEKYFVQDDLQDLFLQSGKNRPEIYFQQNIRDGISTFASLSNREEVKAGLQQLRNDIDYNLFDNIHREYESDRGDYLFIAAHKNASS